MFKTIIIAICQTGFMWLAFYVYYYYKIGETYLTFSPLRAHHHWYEMPYIITCIIIFCLFFFLYRIEITIDEEKR